MTRWQANPGLLSRKTLYGSVVRVPDGELLELSGSATALLALMSTPHDSDEAADALAAASGTDVEVIRRDLDAILPGLTAQGVLVEAR